MLADHSKQALKTLALAMLILRLRALRKKSLIGAMSKSNYSGTR